MAQYCTPIDLIQYANKARLLSQLASSDYGKVPTAEEVLAYFFNGDCTDETEQSLRLLSSRIEQAISNSAGEINGFLALIKTQGIELDLPDETLTTANMDMALARLFDNLDDTSMIKFNADKWTSFFDKIVTGKTPLNKNKSTSNKQEPINTGSAETINATAPTWTQEALSGY